MPELRTAAWKRMEAWVSATSIKAKDFLFFYRQIGLESGKTYNGGFFPANYNQLYYEVHYCLGVKIQPKKYLFAAFAGPTFMQGDNYGTNGNIDNTLQGVGMRIDLQAIYRPVYDIGGGFNLFAMYNNHHFGYVGFRLVLFLSNAYIGSLYPKAYNR